MSEVQVPELDAGTKISFYEVLPLPADASGKVRTCVGQGGFGSLYKVARNNKIYALKLAHKALSDYPPAEREWIDERGDREIAALKSLRHRNIVRVHAFDRWPDEDGRGFIVMDFIDGLPLDQWRINANPSARRICEVFRSIALALHAAHRQDIFHRDLKCLNVLVRNEGEPVIVDWGISRPASTYTITGEREMVGTFTCFSPEYCSWAFSKNKTKFETTPAGELYAVGFMLYEALTGRSPVAMQQNDIETMRAIMTATPARPSTINAAIPSELDELAMRLLEKNPLNRFLTGEVLAGHLTEILAAADARWDEPLGGVVAHDPLQATQPARGRPLLLSKNGMPAEPAPAQGRAAPAALPKLSLLSLKRPAFVAPDLADEPRPPAEARAQSLPPAIAAAAHKLNKRSRRMPVGVGIAAVLGAAVVGIIGVAALARRDAKPKPDDLLARVQQAEAFSADAGAATLASANQDEVRGSLPPAPPGAMEVPAVERDKRAEPSARRMAAASVPDDADMDKAVHTRFGRPTVLPNGKLEEKAPPPVSMAVRTVAAEDDEPAWLKPMQPPASVPAPSKEIGVPTGAHIQARLMTNLDSRTVGDGPAEAKLTRAFLVDGRPVFPSGTLLLGQAQTSGARFTIRFYRLRLPDRREIPFEGLAYDRTERKPGLQASRKIEGAPKQGEGVASKIAKNTTDTLLTAAQGGDLASSLAVGAGRTALDGARADASADQGGTVLLLDANIDFDVFVSKAF